MITPKELFLISSKLTQESVRQHHYLYNAYLKKLNNYRTLTMNEIIKAKREDVPKYLVDFVNTHGRVMAIANPVLNTSPQIQLRAIEEKAFSVLGDQSTVFYGFGRLDKDFKFGDPVILVEGISDRDSIIDLYPNILAVLTAGLTIKQTEILKHLTDYYILMYDNDGPGQKGIMKDKYKLKGLGKTVEMIRHPVGIKDSGELSKFYYQSKSFEYSELRSYYEMWINNLVGGRIGC